MSREDRPQAAFQGGGTRLQLRNPQFRQGEGVNRIPVRSENSGLRRSRAGPPAAMPITTVQPGPARLSQMVPVFRI